MAKLTRVLQRVFGSSAGPDQIAQFGSLFAGSPVFTTSPSTAQALSNWLTGWSGAAIGGNSPAIEDMNAAMFVMTYQLAYLLQEGVPEWNSGTSYYIGSLVNNGTGILYKSLTDDNLNNALSDTTNWRRASGGAAAVASKSANYTVTANDGLIVCNAGGAGFTLTLPLAADVPGQILYLKKIDSTANAVTIACAGADGIDGSATASMSVPNESIVLISDGGAAWNIF